MSSSCLFQYRGGSIVKMMLPDDRLYESVFYSDDAVDVYGYCLALNQKSSEFLDIALRSIKHNRFEILSRFDGCFVFFIYNKLSRVLNVCIDIYGTFPIYFFKKGDTITFSTDLKQIYGIADFLTVDQNQLIENLAYEGIDTKDTIFKEIKRLPAGCVAKFDDRGDYAIESYLVSYVSRIIEPRYNDLKLFACDFDDLAVEVFAEYGDKFSGLKVTSDLSAGLDSSLVSYYLKKSSGLSFDCHFWHDPPPFHSQSIEMPQRFAAHHNLNLEVHQHLAWSDFFTERFIYPYALNHARLSMMIRSYCEAGSEVHFSGNGGDELYKSRDCISNFFDSVYVNYYDLVQTLDLGLSQLLSNRGVSILCDHDYHRSRTVYPQLLAKSSLEIQMDSFDIFHSNGIVGVNPLLDRRLIELFWRFPKKKDQYLSRKEFWKNVGSDIFLSDQLRDDFGQDYSSTILLAGENHAPFIRSLFAQSFLIDWGIIDPDKLALLLNQDGNKGINYSLVIGFLLHAAKMELFLQRMQTQVQLRFAD